MDYSQLSDFEINCEVLAVFDPDVNHMCLSKSQEYFYDCGPAGDGWHQIDIPDFCNDPAGAWPIIMENMISVCAYKRANPGMKAVSWWEADSFGEHITRDDNPLRAAMIVFLMMQEKK